MENDAFYEYFAPKAEQAGIEKGMAKGMAKGMKKGMKKGMEKGMEKGMVASVYNLMQSMKMTSEQAMKALLIPESK